MLRILFFFLFSSNILFGNEVLFLRDNLKKAKDGDYLVTMQNKMYTLFRIESHKTETLFIEEISIPSNVFNQEKISFRTWYERQNPSHTSWTMYEIDLNSGKIVKSYFYAKGVWYEKNMTNSFLTTLLNLRLTKVPSSERKKVGRVYKTELENKPSYWQPKLKIEGHFVEGIPFDAWKGQWPNDKSELSGKSITLFIPEQSDLYPSYLPYWLEIQGTITSAKIRIVDSGRNLTSTHSF